MAQQSLAVTPSSRQDIVSALLSDYGNSFGDEKSPSVYSPAPPTSDLPPLPPRKDSLARKPVPAAQRMDAKFQLRDDQDAPVSPSSSGEDSPSQPRKRIVSRSLSRGSKPASLKLTISNGSTATVPSPPGFQVPSQSVPSFDPAVESRPPPPPPKSEDRNREEMGSKLSKQAKELARSDSLLSPGKSKQSSVVKRKEVPQAGSKNFKSLAELGNGPRGRKGAPAPTSAPRKQDVKPSETQPEEAPRNMQAQFPPTPDEEKDDAETLAQPKKAFGLPSNPRVNALASPLHTQSRSSTGLSSLKAMRPAPPAPTVDVHTTTPEPTPSPTLKPVLAKRDFEISPVSPLPPPNNLRTSVGYEQQQQSLNVEPQPNPVVAVAQQEDVSSSPANPALPYAPTPPIHAKTPLRITSLEFPASKDSRPMSAPSRPVSMTLNGTELSSIPGPSVPSSPVAEAPVPAPAAPEPAAMNANHDTTTTTKQIAPTTPIEQQPQHQPQPSVDQQLSKTLPQQPSQDQQPTPPPSPPFIPLTQQSVPMPLAVVPQITKKHTQCYTNHAQNIWSNNVFQPLACMVCHENSKERKWSCTWCQLRICRACSEELRRVPGKDVGLLVEARRAVEEKVGSGAGVMGEEVMEGSAMGVLGA